MFTSHSLTMMMNPPPPPPRPRCYYLRQKLLHDVCHQFRMTGKRTVVFFGAARFNLSSRGHRPPPLWPLSGGATGWMRTLEDGCERWGMDANAGGWMRTLEDGCERWRMDANAGGWMRTLVPA